MDCGFQPELGSAEFFTAFRQKVWAGRVPLAGAFDLTYRCNYRCIHCMVGHKVAQSVREAPEISTDRAQELLREAAAAGCLFVLFSGGDPLLRTDFLEIYETARRLGLVASVFTNASLVTTEHVRVFRDYPPDLVEVTLYGATEATFDRITGVPGSFRRTWRGIDLLLEGGVRVGLKSMILRDNFAEVPAMEAQAQALGVRFRDDPLVIPRLDGDRSPLLQRVDPEDAVAMELSRVKYRQDLADFVKRADAHPGNRLSERAFLCTAGSTSFHLDPQGNLRPCALSRELVYNTNTLGYLGAWRAAVEACEQTTWGDTGLCGQCSDLVLCGYCPELFALEGATPTQPPEYLCRLGEARRRTLSQDELEVVAHVGVE